MPDTKEAPKTENQVEDKPKLDAEGQKVMDQGMAWDSAFSTATEMSDEEAHALYKSLYGNEASEDNLPKNPNVSESYYMNGMKQGAVPSPVEAPAEQPPSSDPGFSEEEQALFNRLGTPADPDVQTAPEPNQDVEALKAQIAELKQIIQTQQTPQEATPEPQEPVEQDNSREAVERDLTVLDNILKARFGLDLNSVYQQLAYSNQVVDYMNGVQTQQKVQGMQDELKEKWGDQYDYRFGEAKKLYESLSDADKASIDKLGVRGAEMLWAKAEQQIVKEPEVPNFDRGKNITRTTPVSEEKEIITKDYLMSLSEQEYAKQMLPGGKLWVAATEGRIKYDI